MDVWGILGNGSRWWRVVVEGGVDESGEVVWIGGGGEGCGVDVGVGGLAWGGRVVVWRVCEDIESGWLILG